MRYVERVRADDDFEAGVAFAAQGQHELALAAFEAVLRLEPMHLAALGGKGRCLVELGRTRAAMDVFLEAMTLDADDTEHAVQAGLCMLELGLVGRARSVLMSACHSDRERHACAVRVLAVGQSFLVRAARWRERNVPSQHVVGHQLGEACFQIAFELSPKSLEAARGLAEVSAALGKHDEALRWSRVANALTTFN